MGIAPLSLALGRRSPVNSTLQCKKDSTSSSIRRFTVNPAIRYDLATWWATRVLGIRREDDRVRKYTGDDDYLWSIIRTHRERWMTLLMLRCCA